MTARLEIPSHFDPERVGEVWSVPYQERAAQAEAWAKAHDIAPAAEDAYRIALVLVDVQNTFCVPGFQLFVGGRSGTGAVDDNRRLCEFIYRNLGSITRIFPTLDSHQAMQIFHGVFLVDEQGRHPEPYTQVSARDVESGRWRVNPHVCAALGLDRDWADRYLLHYTRSLERGGKYTLTIWPYHAMLGGLGQALVSAVEEAIFFHGVARSSPPDFQVKGDNPLTEQYSVLGPEVTEGPDGESILRRNLLLVDQLLEFDAVVIAGQAKSHCVAWTIDDLLTRVSAHDPALARRVYLLEDCTSPVVVPGIVDYTEPADAAFRRFAAAGMHVVRSVEPMDRWLATDARREPAHSVG